jgi:hypothetical protein
MRLGKLAIAVIAVAGALVGMAGEAFASGGGESCLVTSKSLLSNKTMTGSVVVELLDYDPGANSARRADATLTLTYGRQTAVFRIAIGDGIGGNAVAPVLTPEQVMCDVINASPKATVAVDGGTVERTIFEVFGLPTPAKPEDTLKLCLIVEPTPQGGERVVCQSIAGLDFNPIPGTAADATGAAALVIYVYQ